MTVMTVMTVMTKENIFLLLILERTVYLLVIIQAPMHINVA
jgi:hypothetical protein